MIYKMNINKILIKGISASFKALFKIEISEEKLHLMTTRKDFPGSHTFITFPYGKQTKKNPEKIGTLIGSYLKENLDIVENFNVMKGFLNVEISDKVWIDLFKEITQNSHFGTYPSNSKKVMIEYSSPNTNKPLHLGHLRNNFLGFAVSNILEANGYKVMKTNLINDRGIHICKSMLAYEKFGNGEKPTNDLKGDKLVGKYYVRFDQEYKKEIKTLLAQDKTQVQAEKNAPLLIEVQEMLKKWENGDEKTVALWQKMNQWVYDGFAASYKLMGVSFDKIYQESETYLLGKDIVKEGLQKKVFYRKKDHSVWVDLSNEKLDDKLVLRANGTSVYMTQDIGTADLKYQDCQMEKSIYVVGNEQDHHIKVLKLIMQKLRRPYADGIYHLSYGMVDLQNSKGQVGKMKSREGTVVDADDLIYEMIAIARTRTEVLGKIDGFKKEEVQTLYHTLALGALKYYLLKVEPKKRMIFNPEESIDFQGDTGVYIQFNYAKAKAILRKSSSLNISTKSNISKLEETEKNIIILLLDYPNKVKEAGDNYDPSIVANYAYDLSKSYSKFWAAVPIFAEDNATLKNFRVALSEQVAIVLKKAMDLIGVDMPEKM